MAYKSFLIKTLLDKLADLSRLTALDIGGSEQKGLSWILTPPALRFMTRPDRIAPN